MSFAGGPPWVRMIAAADVEVAMTTREVDDLLAGAVTVDDAVLADRLAVGATPPTCFASSTPSGTGCTDARIPVHAPPARHVPRRHHDLKERGKESRCSRRVFTGRRVSTTWTPRERAASQSRASGEARAQPAHRDGAGRRNRWAHGRARAGRARIPRPGRRRGRTPSTPASP